MIRPLRAKDAQRLKELENGFEWDLSEGFMDGLVYTDEQDNAVLFVGAWQIAEVHMVTDRSWATPGARLFAMQQLHDAFEKRLKAKGVVQVVTWFEEGADRFKMRLRSWGWLESQKKSWHRGVK